MANRVVAPDAGVDLLPFSLGGPGFPDPGVREDTVAAVEPAIGPPDEGVQRLVSVLVAPAVEEDLRLRVRDIVSVAVGDEEKVGRRADPDATEADLEAAHQVEPLLEHRAPVEAAVSVLVLEDQEAIAGLAVRTADGIGVGLRDPDASPVVDGEGHGLLYVGLAREQGGPEAVG